MKTKILTSFLFYLLIVSMIAMSTMQVKGATDTNPEPVFKVNLLAPNTNPARNTWSKLMADTLPKIGIDTDYTNVGWDVIAPRTFSNPATNGYIPTFADGGYDLFFVGLSGDIDYDPTYSYSNTQLSPSGDNFAYYDNDTVSGWISDYTSELDATTRDGIAKKIQGAIADQVPYIPLVNTAGLWAYNDKLSVTENELLLMSTLNLGDGWKNLEVTGKTNLVFAHSYELSEFNTFVLESYIAAMYLNPVLASLFERDPTADGFAYKPLIAKAMPTWDANKTTATVDIRDDVTFSNGHVLNSTDIVNTFRMHMTPAAGSTSYGSLSEFLYKDSNGDANNSVIAVDNNTVQFHFEKPHFLADSIMNLGIYDHQVIGTPANPAVADYDFNSDPETYTIGAGPYIFTSHSATDHNVKLTARADYWNGVPKMNTIEYNKYGDKEAALADLKAGTVDIIDAQMYLEVADVEGQAGISYKIISDFGTQMITVNMGHPILGTGVDTPLGKSDPSKAVLAAKYVRQAISHAVPREEIVNTILKGIGTVGTSLWPDKAAGYDTTLKIHEYNLETSKDLLRKAGYTITTKTVKTPLVNAIAMLFLSLSFAAVIIRKKRV